MNSVIRRLKQGSIVLGNLFSGYGLNRVTSLNKLQLQITESFSKPQS